MYYNQISHLFPFTDM